MERVKILFIDDHDINDDIDLLTRALKGRGFQLDHVFVNVSGEEYKITETGGQRIDVQKLKDKFSAYYFNTHFDIVACDFNFAEEDYNGYELLSWLINTANANPKKRIRFSKFVFYTAETKDFTEVASRDVERLLRLKIEKLIDRPNLRGELTRLIVKTKKEVNLLKEFQSILDDHSDMVFKSTYPKFTGKTLGEIFQEIENETDHGLSYQKALLEQAISHMIQLQED